MSRSRSWHETFFDGLYDQVLAALFEPNRSRKEARLVKRLACLRKGQRVLDVPCGQGRLTLPLAEMGLQMTGVDRTASYLRQARRTARERGFELRFDCVDMREIGFDGEFDAAFNWFGSFGYFSDHDNLRFFGRVFRALKPRGRFLVEGLNKSWLLANFKSRREEEVGGVIVRHHAQWDAQKNRILDTWTLTSRGRTERYRVDIRIYNGTELRSLLRSAGFHDIQLYGYPPIGRLTRHSRRWIAVARRPVSGG